MLDMYSDSPRYTAARLHVEVLEIDDLVGGSKARNPRRSIEGRGDPPMFRFADPAGDPIADHRRERSPWPGGSPSGWTGW